MKSTGLIMIFLCCSCSLWCQEHVVASGVPGKAGMVQVKWFSKELISREGFYVYRQHIGKADWQRLTLKPIRYKMYTPTSSERTDDPELPTYLMLAGDQGNFKSLALIAVLCKSFRSEPFARYLGITVTDSSAGERCRYRVTALVSGVEREVGTSDFVDAQHYEPAYAPEGLKVQRKRRNVQLSWQPEPFRYYGVDIYRKLGDTGSFRQLNNEPVLTTQPKQGGASFFYEDLRLPSQMKICYYLKGRDFFNRETHCGDTVCIYVPDDVPPSLPDSITFKVEGRKIYVSWRKKILEKDLAAIRVFRTNRNDTDYSLRGSAVHGHNFFTDSVNEFGDFFYKIEVLDMEGNRAYTNPRLVKVFDNEVPAAPQGLKIIADTGCLRLSWNQGVEKDIAGYLVYRTIDGDHKESYVKCTPFPVPCCEFIDSLPVEARNRFLYRIVAVDQSLNKSEYSEFAAGKMPDVISPSSPLLRSVKQIGKGIELSWFANAESDLKEYTLRSLNITDSLYPNARSVKISASSVAFTEQDVLPGVYRFYLTATDSAGNISSPSNSITIRVKKPDKEVAYKPRLKGEYNRKSQEVRLNWSSPHNKDVKGIVLYRAETGSEFLPLTGFTEETKLNDKSVRQGSEYRYQVRLYTNDGRVHRSEEVKIIIKS